MGVQHHLQFLYAAGHLYLHNHLVGGDHLLARGQGVELLHDVHLLHKVDITAAGDANLHLAHTPRRVGPHKERSRETKVLGIVGSEVELVALVVAHHQGVDDEIAVEADGIGRADGTSEGVLEQAHLVLIDVHIGEAVLEHGGDNFARVDKVVEALAALGLEDGLLLPGVAAVECLGDFLIHSDRKDELARFGAHLHMVLEERHALELVVLEHVGGELVE